MKEGNYCLYNNNIYDYSIDFDGNSFVSTTDKSIIDDSFAGPNMRGFYKKKVNISELDKVFRAEHYVTIDGTELDVLGQKDEMVLVGTSDARVAERLGLGRTDKYYYEKWIAKQNTEIKERIVDLNA